MDREHLEHKLSVLSELSRLYASRMVNYIGSDIKSTHDGENTKYTEIIAEWLLNNFELLNKSFERSTICRTGNPRGRLKDKPYYVKAHQKLKKASNKKKSEEKRIAQQLFINRGKIVELYPCIGKIIDYQTPLKNVRSDRAGEIDVLALKDDMLSIIELKKPNSRETLLRCILEAYTYYRTIKDKDTFRASFKDVGQYRVVSGKHPRFMICPLFFAGSQPDKDMRSSHEYLKELVKTIENKSGLRVTFLRINKHENRDVTKWDITDVTNIFWE